jgi:hypothetical protein
MRGTELAARSTTIWCYTPSPWPIVTPHGGAFSVRCTSFTKLFAGGSADAADLAACNTTEPTTTLLVGSTEISARGATIWRHTPRTWPIVTTQGITFNVLLAALPQPAG